MDLVMTAAILPLIRKASVLRGLELSFVPVIHSVILFDELFYYITLYCPVLHCSTLSPV